MNAAAVRLESVRARIQGACEAVGRPEGSVALVAVSKWHAPAAISEAYDAGQRIFGESYVPELEEKVNATRHLPGIEFRFIGHLQSNKAARVARIASAVDSVDSVKLARALDRHAERTLRVMVQVNALGEQTKSGVALDQVESLAGVIAELPNLHLEGLMTLPPPSPDLARRAFEGVAELAGRLGLAELSMGMSDDLELAIACGSTQVRVGTAIFGPRSD